MTVSKRRTPCFIYPTMPQELQIKYTHTNVFLAVASTEICVIPVDTAVEDLPQYNLSIITSKFVI